MNIPQEVSGRPVTNRGVHLLPFGFHETWLARADYWIELMQSMYMSWCLIISESDSALISGACKALLDGGIIPIVRFAYEFPNGWEHGWVVDNMMPLYAHYNVPLIVQFANEPFDTREWENGKVLPNAWDIIAQRWREAANAITARGAIAGFPDGPCYDRNPFLVIGDDNLPWQEGRAVYLGHHYGLGRDLMYPEDEVSRKGTQYQTYAEYQAELDDMAGNPDFDEGEWFVLNKINPRRKEWADPDLTPIDDDTCFRGYEKVLHWGKEAFGFEVPIAMTEGGWTPKARAGAGDGTDYRWPLYTLNKVAEVTLQMYEHSSPLFCLCPWILSTWDMGGAGWDSDEWVGYWYEHLYGREKPVVKMLQDNPPGSTEQDASDKIIDASLDLLGAIFNLEGAIGALEGG